MKTAELTGAALDWAVANCVSKLNGLGGYVEEFIVHPFSTDWAQGGPIIEREKIALTPCENLVAGGFWEAEINSNDYHNKQTGQTPLIAAMRCYVASKLGDEVEVPSELMSH